MKPISAMVPKALAGSGHTAQVIREPYGVTMVFGPFNGPLILLLDPAITALSAGNPCILKLAESVPATSTLLQKGVSAQNASQAALFPRNLARGRIDFILRSRSPG